MENILTKDFSRPKKSQNFFRNVLRIIKNQKKIEDFIEIFENHRFFESLIFGDVFGDFQTFTFDAHNLLLRLLVLANIFSKKYLLTLNIFT